ncbi:hypothetical protein BH11MYX3_BH11MYX3_20320 [soil metagenome]
MVLLIGCSSGGTRPVAQPANDETSCPSAMPLGSLADYRPPTDLPNTSISTPQQCAGSEAYIRVERSAGARKLGTGRGKGGGFDEGCQTLPADPGDATQCPVINAGAILMAAHAELEKRSIVSVGVGLGPCGDVQADYDGWNMAAGVHDWKDAEQLVRIVAELLERYDAVGHVGVAVRGIHCVAPL